MRYFRQNTVNITVRSNLRIKITLIKKEHMWNNDDFEVGKNFAFLQSYWPINLLSSLTKTVRRIIKTRLEEYIDDPNVFPKDHFASWKRLGTELQIIGVVEKIK